MKQAYRDILNLPHYEPRNHPRMSRMSRAAQFAPFAALTGHDAAIAETARYTRQRTELDESEIAELDRRLREIQNLLPNAPKVTITYFQADPKKDGGSYIDAEGFVRKIDLYEHSVVLTEGCRIPIQDIIDIRLSE